jgi:hypothetical protein
MAVADEEVADALRRSFLGRLPRDVVDELIAGLVATGPDNVLIVDPTGLHDQAWSAAAE